MGRNTSVSLGEHFERFVQQNITDGRYKNASEVVRAGLRLLEDEECRFAALKEAIQEGLSSGCSVEFNPMEHLARMKFNSSKPG